MRRLGIGETVRSWARQMRRDGVTLWFACRDPRTPLPAKAIAVFVVAYALSPIDLIPDFIPVLGYLDEAILLPGLIWVAIRLVPPPVLDANRERADAWIAARKRAPRSIAGLLIVLVLWGLLAWWIWKLFRR